MTILFTRHQSLPTQFEELALGSSICSMHLPSLFLRPMSQQQSFTLFLPEEASPDRTRWDFCPSGLQGPGKQDRRRAPGFPRFTIPPPALPLVQYKQAFVIQGRLLWITYAPLVYTANSFKWLLVQWKIKLMQIKLCFKITMDSSCINTGKVKMKSLHATTV